MTKGKELLRLYFLIIGDNMKLIFEWLESLIPTDQEWLSMMDEEFKGDTCLDAWAVANCLYKGKAA
jgi:hypothetical protein